MPSHQIKEPHVTFTPPLNTISTKAVYFVQQSDNVTLGFQIHIYRSLVYFCIKNKYFFVNLM